MRSRVLIWIFTAIAIGAAGFFIFFRLAAADPLTDEEELAFRAVGNLDFLATPAQTTPYEWFASPPWWVHLSFHDHPPLIFWVEHVFFKFFGDSLFVLRLPFALAGLLTLVFVFLLTRELFGKNSGVLALLLAAVNTYLIWLSRIGLQEVFVVLICLFCLWALLRARYHPRYLIWWGIGVGLAGLTKYTALFLVIALAFVYFLLYKTAVFKSRHFWIGVAVAFLLVSPVLIYNLAMYAAVGHFDVQISALLGQKTPEWPFLLGKATGSLTFRLKSFLPNLIQNMSPVFFVLSTVSFFAFCFKLARQKIRREPLAPEERLLFWAIVITILLIVWIGPSQRFLAMLVPFAIMLAAFLFSRLVTRTKSGRGQLAVYVLLAAILVSEGVYNFRTNHTLAVSGSAPWSFSLLRYESSAWGYNELERYLAELLDKSRPQVELALPPRLQFVENFRAADFRGAKNHPAKADLIIYDPRLNNVAKLWLYDRRYYYDGWPFVSIDEYLAVAAAAPDYFQKLGITDYYYIATEPELFTGDNTTASEQAEKFNGRLTDISPVVELFDGRGNKTFQVYYSNAGF